MVEGLVGYQRQRGDLIVKKVDPMVKNQSCSCSRAERTDAVAASVIRTVSPSVTSSVEPLRLVEA